MNGRPEVAGTSEAPDPTADTVEFELSDEQLALLRAAETPAATTLASPPLAAQRHSYDNYVYARTRRIDVLATITFAALVFVVTAFSGWYALVPTSAARAGSTSIRLAPPVPVQSAPAAQPDTDAALVRVVNPFDSSEVFELPAQTTPEEAKEMVAALLMQRARERNESEASRPNIRYRHHSAATRTAALYATRLVGTPIQFTDATRQASGSAPAR